MCVFVDTGMRHSQWKFLCQVMNLKGWQLPVMCPGLGVPGRLLLADGEDSSRPSARGWFGKQTIQTSSFLLWTSAAERRGLCS